MLEGDLFFFDGIVSVAIYDATGVWMNSQPFTPEKVVKALREHGIGII